MHYDKQIDTKKKYVFYNQILKTYSYFVKILSKINILKEEKL